MNWERIEKIMAEVVEAQKKNEAQMARTDKRLDKVAKMVGGMSNNSGHYAEETFYAAFQREPRLGDYVFQEVGRNWRKKAANGGPEAEYDIVLMDGPVVGVVEVKFRMHPNDVKKFAEQKLPFFQKIFPDYADKQVVGAIAKAGFACLVLKPQGLWTALGFPEDSLEVASRYNLFAVGLQGRKIKILNESRAA